jgi:Domain of unknown function (DUF4203)
MANKYAFSALIILAGLFLTFLGKRMLFITEIFTGVTLTLFLVLYFILSNIQVTLNTWQFWLIVGLSIGLGALVGWGISYLEWLPPAILGGILGYIGGVLLYNIVLRFIQSNPIVVFWLTVLACIAIGVALSIYFKDFILIVSTSILGSYAIIRVSSNNFRESLS